MNPQQSYGIRLGARLSRRMKGYDQRCRHRNTADTLSRAGALRQKALIEDWWRREFGISIDVRVERISAEGILDPRTFGIFVVRSNLIDGLPKRPMSSVR